MEMRLHSKVTYSAVLSDANEEITDWLERLTANKQNWGFGLCFCTCNTQRYGRNHKPVHWIYCKRELNLRLKTKKRLNRNKPEPLAVPEGSKSRSVNSCP